MSYIASKIFPELKGLSLKEIKAKHKDQRQKAKSAGFAINYGGNGSTIAENLNITEEEGAALYNAYFEAFPGIKAYFKAVADDAIAKGYILFNKISGSKCFIESYDKYKELEKQVTKLNFWDEYRREKTQKSYLFETKLKPIVSKYFKLRGEITRMALNYPIQGSSAEITKIAAIKIFNYLLSNNLIGIVLFPNVIHDEILLECPEDLKDRMKDVVEISMSEAGTVYCKTIPLKADAVICKYWNH